MRGVENNARKTYGYAQKAAEMKKILFTGGGSAGHVVPNLALIDSLKKRGAYEIFYAGTNGIEKRLLAPTGIPFLKFHARNSSVRSLLKTLRSRFLYTKRFAIHEKFCKTSVPISFSRKAASFLFPSASPRQRKKFPF